MVITRKVEFSASHICRNPQLSEQENRNLFGAAANPHGHGHNYVVEVSLAGDPDPVTGMVLDLGLLERNMAEVQKMLDHKLLNKVEALGPPTLENLSRFVWERLQQTGRIARVSIYRDSCNESCTYYGPQG